MTFTYQSSAKRYLLSGPEGDSLDEALAFTIDVGMQAERIAEGAYRLSGDDRKFSSVCEWIEYFKQTDVACAVEARPANLTVGFKVAAPRPSLRSAFVHGGKYSSVVRRAVDMGLSVTSAGIQRFEIRGSSMTQAHWLAAAMGKTLDEALKEMSLTRESAAAEDTAAAELPPISIHLPPRETTSDIVRDRQGLITKVTQLERSV
ncbi:hypothetical protein [Rhizobacter fulvus]